MLGIRIILRVRPVPSPRRLPSASLLRTPSNNDVMDGASELGGRMLVFSNQSLSVRVRVRVRVRVSNQSLSVRNHSLSVS